MRLLLDQGLPRGAVSLLHAAGHSPVHVAEVGLSRADDGDILRWARSHRRVVVTLDADFHALIALSGARGPSVIRIRIEGLRAERLAALLLAVLSRCAEEIRAGALVSVVEAGIRIRRLPIARGERRRR